VLAAYWRDEILEGRRRAARVRRYVEVRYEDLVLDTERVVRQLAGLLALPWDASMLRFYERAPDRLDEHEERRNAAGEVWLTKAQRRQQQIMTTRPPERARIDGWRTALGAREQADFERVAGDLLAELGYV
jgi:hypothetical protein